MKKLCVLLCSLIVFVFCACVSQTSQSQNTQTANEPNLDKLKAECEKNNAKSCYDLGFTLLNDSERYSSESQKPFDTKMLNLANNYLLKSCNLNYADGCYFYAVSKMMNALNLSSSEKIKLQKSFTDKNFTLDKVIGKDKTANIIKYIQKACDLGSAQGCASLGEFYQNGQFVNKDKNLSYSSYKKACEVAQPHKEMDKSIGWECMKLGVAYYNGQSVVKNKETALKYFFKGCELSNFVCGNYVRRFYEGYNGDFIKLPQDYEFAFQLAKKGCELKDKASCNYLGILYQEGKGTTQDVNKAFLIFQNLCYGESDYKITGCYNLALCYANGKGVEQDYKRAFNSFKELCDENKVSSACAITGEYYYNAKGIRQDYRKAMEYFGKACDMGEQSGCDNHKMMKQNPYAYGLKPDDFK